MQFSESSSSGRWLAHLQESWPAAALAGAILLLAGAGTRADPLTRVAGSAPAPQALAQIQSLLREGRYAEGESTARQALADAETREGPDSSPAADLLDLLVEALWRGGKASDPAAQSLARRALEIREGLLPAGHADIARSLHNLGILARLTGDYAAARTFHERALAIREKALGPGDPRVADSLAALADAVSDAGDYSGARPLYERALAIREKALGPDHPDVASSLNGIGVLLSDIGDYPEAKRVHERALEIRERALGPAHPDVAASLSNLATVFADLDDYPRARPLLERALAIRERVLGPEHPLVAGTLNNLAKMLADTGNLKMARPLYERAITIQEKALGRDHPVVAVSLNNLAKLLAEQGDGAGAKQRFERVLAIREKVLGPESADVAETLKDLSRLEWGLGESEPAVEHALRAEALTRREFQRTAAGLSEQEALGYERVRARGLDLALSVLVAQSAASGKRPAGVSRVWEELVRSRALVLDEMAARHQSVFTSGSAVVAALNAKVSAARAHLSEILVHGPEPGSAGRYKDKLERADEDLRSAERALAAENVPFRERLERRAAGLPEVAKALPPGSSLVAYVQYNHRPGPKGTLAEATGWSRGVPTYLALVLSADDRAPAVVPLGAARDLHPLIRRWSEAGSTVPRGLQVAGSSSESKYRQAGDRLRRAIWDPVAAEMGHPRQVFIVPDGALNVVSLASLPTREDRYLVETGPLLHYLSTERDLVRPRGNRPTGEGLLVLGGADYDARPKDLAEPRAAEALTSLAAGGAAGSGPQSHYRGPTATCVDFSSLHFEPLPGSEAEAEDVGLLWAKRSGSAGGAEGKVLSLIGAAAGEAALKNGMSGRRILHLATHGFFAEDRCLPAPDGKNGGPGEGADADPVAMPVPGENPLLLSGLALAGANRRAEAASVAAGEDGILTADEIAALDLSSAEWVILSGCETGIGKVQVGEGVLGLRRAFEISGAGTVIMSLWAVEDAAAREWMRNLYGGRGEGLATPEAVRQAAVSMIEARRRAGRSTHPFYWGAFVAVGDWR